MKWYRWVGIVLAAISAVCLIISSWPVTKHSNQVTFTNSEGIAGTLHITQPSQMNVGGKSEISLQVIINQNQNEISSLIILSKLEMDNITVTPKGEGKVTIDPTKPLMLNWQITPFKSGVHSGTLWLFMLDDDGEKNLVLARPIELTTKTLFGLSLQIVKMLSIIGLLFGLILLFPFFRKK